MNPIAEHDLKNNRVWAMWTEKGMNYRSNIMLEPGASIPLHTHSYDHHASVKGNFLVKAIGPDGEAWAFSMTTGEITLIPAGFQHTFTFVANGGKPGVVICYWPESS